MSGASLDTMRRPAVARDPVDAGQAVLTVQVLWRAQLTIGALLVAWPALAVLAAAGRSGGGRCHTLTWERR